MMISTSESKQFLHDLRVVGIFLKDQEESYEFMHTLIKAEGSSDSSAEEQAFPIELCLDNIDFLRDQFIWDSDAEQRYTPELYVWLCNAMGVDIEEFLTTLSEEEIKWFRCKQKDLLVDRFKAITRVRAVQQAALKEAEERSENWEKHKEENPSVYD